MVLPARRYRQAKCERGKKVQGALRGEDTLISFGNGRQKVEDNGNDKQAFRVLRQDSLQLKPVNHAVEIDRDEACRFRIRSFQRFFIILEVAVANEARPFVVG